MALTTGAKLGHYEIISALGAGGMGEVYRARDTRLKRDVALKLLPTTLSSDPDRLARFAREAELLASLNHPHIAAIYGLEESGDRLALVLELVEGPTLADRITRGDIPLREALGIGAQIAAAIEAAHERGIIHRDLKPANIKLTPDGVVKVLDFGLAKAIAADSAAEPIGSTIIEHATQPGAVLGTAAYMSPEQARGMAVDTRTDVWAFACVLYELLTRRRAFNGRTSTDILATVLNSEPDWSALPPETPAGVQQVLRRSLQKDHKRRLRHIGDARLELEEADSAPSRAAVQLAPAVRAGRSVVPWLVAGAAAAAAAWFAVRAPAPVADSLTGLRVERLTYDAGLNTMPAISHDGRLIAYASDRAGRGDLDIWVQLADGSPLRLTDDPADDVTPHFSRDGNQIVFRSERAGGGIYVMPSLGGTPRLIAAEGRNPQFSPDGTRVAYWVGGFRGGSTAPSETYVVPLGGGERQRLLTDFRTARDPIWAPDARSLLVAAVRSRTPGRDEVDWWWTAADGGAASRTGANQFAPVKAALATTERAEWTEGGLLFTDGRDLWTLPIAATGAAVTAPRRLTVGAQDYSYPSVASDGRIVFASAIIHRVISRAAVSAASDAPAPIRLYEDSRETGGRASQTADGSRIVFERALPEGREIWMKTVASGQEQLIARVSERALLNATVSPDGSRVGYTTAQGGYIVESSGGVPRQFCTKCLLHGFLSDNRRVLTMGPLLPGISSIGLIDTADGTSRIVVQGPEEARLNRPHASPDDRWIAFRRERGVGEGTFVAPLRPDRPVTLEESLQVNETTPDGRPAGWSLDSRTLYLLLDTDGWRCLWGQTVDDKGRLVGQPFPARHFHGFNESTFGTTLGNAISADGFLFEGVRRTADIWMLRR